MHRIAAPPHLLLFITVALLGGILLAGEAGAAPPGPHRFVEGEVLVSFSPDARPADVNAILKDLGAKRVRKFRRTPAERHRIAMPVTDAVAKYRGHPALRFIEPNYIVHADVVPNDPSFGIQWSLRNTGQQAGTPGSDIHATAAWDQATGSPLVIAAIVDTGMDLDHPDLVANLYTNPAEVPGNLIDDDGNGYVDDVHGFDFANFDGDPDDDNNHGTHVAGTIGASGNNGIGIAGVVWRVRLLPLKFLDQNGSGTTGDAIDCIDYAVAAGATVINASWGGGDDSFALRQAISLAGDAGVLFVVAAGNSSANTDEFDNFPANFPFPNIISVGSSGRSDERSGFSNYGAATVDLFAPGTQIVSTVRDGLYAQASGTSMAAPHVTGAVALLKSRFPGMPAATMKAIILASTDRVPLLAGLCVTGGRLGVARMLEGLDSIPPAPSSLALANASSDRLTLRWTAPGDDGVVGTATEYDLRVSGAPIDASNFLAAQRVTGLAPPRASGSAEEAVIRGLAPHTDYYAAVVALDEFGNRSLLSNVISARTTAPPVAVVEPVSLEADLRTGQQAALPLALRNDGEGALDFTVRAVGPGGAAAPPWIRLDPLSGTAPSGGLAAITVTFSAAGLGGGNYLAAVRFETNDPTRPTLDVPVAFHVTSAPDVEIFPFPLNFGPVAIGETGMQGLLVTNAGFDDLHVTSVSASGDGFSVDETPFDLPPGASWEILATVVPSQTGAIHGTLALECDDPDEPSPRIPMAASGIVPATIAVTPAHESASLHTGQTATRAFTITNGGGSFLSWSVRTRSAGALVFDSTGAQVPPVARTEAPLTALEQVTDISDVRIVFDSRHGASPGAWSSFIGSMVSRGALFAPNAEPLTSAVLDEADVYWISDAAGAFLPSERAALAEWVRGGGALLVEGEATAADEFDALLDSLAVPVEFVANQGITGPSPRIYPYEITRGVSAANLPSESRLRLTGEGATVVIEDAEGVPAMAAAFVGRGRVLTVGGRLFADAASIFVENRKIATQSLDWLGGAAWLSVTPPFGGTAPGRSTVVTARFDASRLAGADYRAAIVFVSNDPAHEKFLVPVDLTLTPAPDVESSPSSLDLGAVFVGASGLDSVRIQNVGVLPLRVASISVDHPDFSSSPSSFTLSPGAIGTVILAYAPSSVGPAAATLSFETDDPDERTVAVPITGSGIPAPDIEVATDSLTASLATGLSVTRTLLVRNSAGSDLEFSVRFEEDALGPSADGGGVAAASAREEALPRSWADARSWAAANAPNAGPAGAAGSASGVAASSAAATDSLPLVLVDPRGDGGVMDVLLFWASARGGFLRCEIATGSDILPANLGGYLSLDLDQNPNTGRAPSFGAPRQDIGAEYEIGFFSVQFGSVDLFEAHTGNYAGSFPVEASTRRIRFSIPLSALLDDDGRMNVSGVLGNSFAASDWFPMRGHGTINGLWTAAAPAGGTLPAGAEQVVTLAVDALALSAGTYRGNVVVESNDPDESRLLVPAALLVTNGPWITATASRVDLGRLFLGQTAAAEFLVGNTGTAPLHAAVGLDQPEFTASPTSFTLEPGATQIVSLAFQSASEGQKLATVTVTHDAPGPAIGILLSAEAMVAPRLAVAPDSIFTAIPLDGTGSVYVAVENRGGSTLDFGIEVLNRTAGVTVHEALELDRDAEDPRPPIRPAGLGGPDAFGYRWVDSDQIGGPVFDWQEISGIGTRVPIRMLDQNSGPLPIGFEFPFYDRVFTTFNVCTHGYISFTDTTVHFLNQPLPGPAAPPNLLAVFWDDLNFGGVERAYYHNDGTRLIVEFDNVVRRSKGGPFTFQAILYPSGAIVYQYLLMGAPTTSGTIGIQNRTKTDGLGVLFNSEGLHDRMAVRFSSAPGWLTIHQRFGRLDPGGLDSVQIAIDMRRLFAGFYDGQVRVTSNDPLRPEAFVPVRLRATGIPDLMASPSSLRFDTLFVGESALDTLRITNQGTDLLEVSMGVGGGDFTADPASLDLAPLQSAEVTIRFAPRRAGDRSALLSLASNDPDSPLVPIPIAAAARYRVREIQAEVIPSTIQRGSRGKQIKARVLLPADLDAARVLLPGVRFLGVVPPVLADTRLRDLNGDGRADLELAFDRAAVERALPEGDLVPVAVTGEVEGIALFAARDSVRAVGTRVAAPGILVEDEAPPASSALHANAPNPFRAATAFRFDVASPGPATVRVYAASGRLVRTLLAAPLPAGRFLAGWDGRDDRGAQAPSGVYFVRLTVTGPEPSQTVRRWTRVR